MKLKSRSAGTGKLGRSSVFTAVTALVIVGVILVNLLVTALCTGKLWFLDLTPDYSYRVDDNGKYVSKTTSMYRLMDETKRVLGQTFEAADANRAEDDPVQVEILFCNDPDQLTANDKMRYIYYTALALEQEFPKHIKVSTVNVWENPSAVDAYRTTSYTSIYQSNIIVSSGSEFRVYTPSTFYVADSAGGEPWAYHGEKWFTSGILAVTKLESPVCCLTVNHGEPIMGDEFATFRRVVENAGYDVRTIDLSKEAIPNDCRLIVTLGPTTDFDYQTEITKLGAYLDEAYSFLIFEDAATPTLPILDEYLEEWGITFRRYSDTASYRVEDPEHSIDGSERLIGQYESTGVGGVLTEDLRDKGNSPKVIFPDAAVIDWADTYVETAKRADDEQGLTSYTEYIYGTYFKNGHDRAIYDVFRSGKNSAAFAVENGEHVKNGENEIFDSTGAFRLMTLTRENRTTSEGNGMTTVNEASYVCAVSSVAFASDEMLNPELGTSNAYGNTDLLLSVLRYIGKEVQPSGIRWKMLYDDEIDADAHSVAADRGVTALLALLPAVILTATGTVILVRRKVRR